MNSLSRVFVILFGLGVFSGVGASTEVAPVSLETLIVSAIQSDHWLERSASLEQAYREDAVASGELPDPRVSLAFANVPTDSFSLAQEPMTQIVIGFSQTFPGGDARSLSRSRSTLLGDMSPVQRALREVQLRQEVSMTWLDARLAETSIQLIREDRSLFLQLIAVAQSRYAAALGSVNQQDVIRAQLELTRLDERLLRLNELAARKHQKLGEWVPHDLLESPFDWQIPSSLLRPGPSGDFLRHPEVRLLDQDVELKRTDRLLADESTKPGITVATSYSMRDQDRFGNDLADLVTVGVTMDLPLFRGKRQTKKIAAAANRVSAAESARLLRLQQLRARFEEVQAASNLLERRVSIYEDTLLVQTQNMARSALSAYRADESDFADVARAYIALLNTKIELEGVRTDLYKALVEIRYLTSVYTPQEQQS